jgi:hypothetical protein
MLAVAHEKSSKLEEVAAASIPEQSARDRAISEQPRRRVDHPPR